jgi:MoaA/NifB/PqqE/SkfB family radical SAM enzyme
MNETQQILKAIDQNKLKKKLTKRAYTNLLYGLLNPNLPSYLILYVNNICQLRCDMCFYWDAMQVKTEQLSLGEITKLSKSLPNLFQLTLTGGEPSLSEDLPKIPKIFSENSNLSKCTIVTNGMLSERIAQYVEEMTKDNPEVDFRMSVSIDAIGDQHDSIRGVKGSYDNAIKTLDLLIELKKKVHNLWIDVNTTMSKYNYLDFEDIHNYILKNFNVDNHVTAFTRGKTKEDDAAEIPIEYYAKYKKIIQRDGGNSSHNLQKAIAAVRDVVMDEVDRELVENRYNFDCSAGKKFLEVYQDGRVVSCEILETLVSEEETSMGNIKDFDCDVKKLLESERAQNILNYIKQSKCHCTFECPKHMDVLYNKKFYPKLVRSLVKNYLSS